MGNKDDVGPNSRMVDWASGKRMSDRLGFDTFYETSAVTGHNVENALEWISGNVDAVKSEFSDSKLDLTKVKVKEKSAAAPSRIFGCCIIL